MKGNNALHVQVVYGMNSLPLPSPPQKKKSRPLFDFLQFICKILQVITNMLPKIF